MYNTYMNTYMKKRWATRRSKAIESLGGVCAKCSSTEELDFDHIDPSTKEFTLAAGSSFSECRFLRELAKCQLLCKSCHKSKSSLDGSNQNKHRITVCDCGKTFSTTKSYAGHKRWCKGR